MYIDFLEKTWHRVTVQEKDVEKVKKAIEDGLINSSDDVFDICEANYYGLSDLGTTQVDPEEHDMYATIMAFNQEHEVIHANGKH